MKWGNALYFLVLLAFSCAFPQAPTRSGSQQPKTSPMTKQLLSSYEGQTVTSIELAGRPDISTDRYAPIFVQQAGQPFSREKIDQTVAVLKREGKFEEIQLEVEPEANGVR